VGANFYSDRESESGAQWCAQDSTVCFPIASGLNSLDAGSIFSEDASGSTTLGPSCVAADTPPGTLVCSTLTLVSDGAGTGEITESTSTTTSQLAVPEFNASFVAVAALALLVVAILGRRLVLSKARILF
jgi:hypothetical protein